MDQGGDLTIIPYVILDYTKPKLPAGYYLSSARPRKVQLLDPNRGKPWLQRQDFSTGLDTEKI
jgi:hypothetical protein